MQICVRDLNFSRRLASKSKEPRRCHLANIPSRPSLASAVQSLAWKICLLVFFLPFEIRLRRRISGIPRRSLRIQLLQILSLKSIAKNFC